MIIPALDLIDGQVVRLFQGDYGQKTQYSDDPAGQFKLYTDAGAEYLHLVDLTGAKAPDARQLPLISKLAASCASPLQVGGGVRTEQDIQGLLDAGVRRVVIGSLAVTQPQLVASWLAQFGPEQIVLAFDVRIDSQGNKYPATHGWQEQAEEPLELLLDFYLKHGLKHVLCTDISRDGTLAGPNLELYQSLCEQYPSIQWQASGGVSSLEDVKALKPAGVAGVITGRALLEGKFTTAEAIACWQDA